MSDSEVYVTKRRLPRGKCQGCGRDVALRRGGELREHRTAEGRHNPTCAWSGQRPDAEDPIDHARRVSAEDLGWELDGEEPDDVR